MKRIQLDSGFVYDYTNMMLPGGVTEADVTNLGTAISDALAAAEETRHHGVGRREHVGSIALVLCGIHHVIELGLHHDTCRQTGSDTRCHTMTTPGLDDDDSVGSLCTIESRSIAENGYFLYIGRRNVVENIVVETIMEHHASILLLYDDTINDNQGLCIDIEGVQTVYKHHASRACIAITGYRMYFCTHALLDFVLYTHRIGILETRGRLLSRNVGSRNVF